MNEKKKQRKRVPEHRRRTKQKLRLGRVASPRVGSGRIASLLPRASRSTVLVPREMPRPVIVHGLVPLHQLILRRRDLAEVHHLLLVHHAFVRVREQALPRASVAVLRLPTVGQLPGAARASVWVPAGRGQREERRNLLPDVQLGVLLRVRSKRRHDKKEKSQTPRDFG